MTLQPVSYLLFQILVYLPGLDLYDFLVWSESEQADVALTGAAAAAWMYVHSLVSAQEFLFYQSLCGLFIIYHGST